MILNLFFSNHSRQYHAAIVLADAEYFLEKFYSFPRGIPFQCLLIVLGLAMVIGGEYLRKLTMYTTQQSFSHPQEDKTNQ